MPTTRTDTRTCECSRSDGGGSGGFGRSHRDRSLSLDRGRSAARGRACRRILGPTSVATRPAARSVRDECRGDALLNRNVALSRLVLARGLWLAHLVSSARSVLAGEPFVSLQDFAKLSGVSTLVRVGLE